MTPDNRDTYLTVYDVLYEIERWGFESDEAASIILMYGAQEHTKGYDMGPDKP